MPQSWTRLGSPNQYFLQGTRPRSDANATLRPKRNKAAPVGTVGQQKTASRIPIPPGPSPALTICVYPPSVRVASRQYRNRCIPRDPQIPWIEPSGSGFPPTRLGIRLLCLGHSHLLAFDGSGKGRFLGGRSLISSLERADHAEFGPSRNPILTGWGWQMLTWTLPALRKSLAVGNGTLKYAKITLIHPRSSVRDA